MGNRPSRLAAKRLAFHSVFCIKLTALAVMGAVALGMPEAAVAQEATVRIQLPAQPLDDSLIQLGRQTELQFFYTPQVVAGVMAPSVQGAMTPEQALRRLLEGTPVQYRRDGKNITLSRLVGATELAPVTVQGGQGGLPPAYAGGQVARGARLGLLGNVDVMDTPFTVTSYTAETIENQGARTVTDVLRNDPSVRSSTPAGHPFENFRIRNFAVAQNELTIGGMYGMAPYSRTPVEMFERVELLRGPSALFTGMAPAGALGGTINLVPKRAADAPLSRVSLDYSGKRQFGTRFDLGRRFGPDNAAGLRLNGTFSDGDTTLDGQSRQRQFVSAAFDYRNGGFKGSLDAYYSKEKFRGGTSAGILFRNVGLGVLPVPDTSLNQLPGAYGEAENKAAIARAEYRFNDRVTAYANVGVRHGKVAGFFTGTWATPTSASGAATVSMSGQRMYEKNLNAEAGLRMHFGTGDIKHEVTLQASRLKMDYGYDARSNSGATNIYDPVTVAMPALPGSALKWSDKTFDSIALVDTLSMLDDSLRLTLGLRHQSLKVDPTAAGVKTGGEVDYHKRVVTPAVGVVFKPWGEAVSLYASYVQGLSQGNTISTQAGYVRNHTFAPYKAKQGEIGVKWNAGAMTNTLAFFQITQPTLISFPVAGGGMDATDGGEKRVRGLEWNVFGEITRGVRVLGGVTYAQSTQTKTQGGLLDGYAAVGAPKWQANLGVEWDVPGASGLTLTGRVQANASQWLTNDHTLKLPGYGVFDVGARYATKLYGSNAVLRLNVANVFNRNYYSGIFREGAAIATLGAPRMVSASLTVDF